jgi:hypothetical protein
VDITYYCVFDEFMIPVAARDPPEENLYTGRYASIFI